MATLETQIVLCTGEEAPGIRKSYEERGWNFLEAEPETATVSEGMVAFNLYFERYGRSTPGSFQAQHATATAPP